MPLTPEAIYKDFINGDLDKQVVLELLLNLIDNAENIETRLESIKILNKIQIDDEKAFEFLEQLLVSDSNEDIRNLTILILKNNFLDRALSPMIWALEHENSLKCLISIISTISEIESDEAKSILIKKFRNKNQGILIDFLKERNIENISNKELGDILINHYLISFLKTKFGYFRYKYNKNGRIYELDLSNVERYSSSLNKLENYLEPIFTLKGLKKCDLRFNHLTTFPDIINNSIEYLDLSYNKLVKLPNIQNFNVLKSLNLKSNRLRILPDSFQSQLTLKYLNLRNNMLIRLPKSIGLLSSLKVLDLHGNKLNSINFNLSNSIKELELGWNNLKVVPNGIQSTLSVERMGLGGNKLTGIPKWFGKLNKLKHLDIYDNELTEIPESIGQLTLLEHLNVRNNQITELPSSLVNLKSIKYLNLSWNNLRNIPEWIGSLSLLEELNLWGNQLKTLPESIASLSSLKVLDLNFNQFDEKPQFLEELEQINGLVIKL
jgi:Leucine-rich repeat (LRR) protein